MFTINGHTTGETITGTGTWQFHDATVNAILGAGPTTSVWCGSSRVEGEGGVSPMFQPAGVFAP